MMVLFQPFQVTRGHFSNQMLETINRWLTVYC